MMPMHRAPAVRWARAFALGALTLFIVLGALELALRRDGMRPSIADSKYLWAQHRNMAKEGAAVIILVGSSKFQGAIDPALIERRIPSTSVANLAMHGKSPFPVLSDLARDREVVGTVLVEFMPSRFFRHEHHTVRDTEAHIRSMDRLPVVSGVETAVRHWFQSQFVVVSRWLSPRRLVLWALGREHDVLALSRSYSNRFSARRFPENFPSPAYNWNSDNLSQLELERRVEELRAWVQAIEGRGGRVVFVNLGASGTAREMEEQLWPEPQGWSWFRAQFPANSLGPEDLRGMNGIVYPDGIHADATDTTRLTRSLVDALLERQLVVKPH